MQQNKLIVADLKQMERRVTCWYVGDNEMLDRFREGFDPYCYQASILFGHEVTKEHKPKRQVGKLEELAFSYQGGIGACATMSENTGIDLLMVKGLIWETITGDEFEKAEYGYEWYLKRHLRSKKYKKQGIEPLPEDIAFVCDVLKQRWRKANPKVVKFWALLDHAAKATVKSGETHTVHMPGGQKFVYFMNDIFLYCMLPTGRCLAYPYPRVGKEEQEDEDTEQDDADAVQIEIDKTTAKGERLSYGRTHPESHKWVRVGTYGGKLAENKVQGGQREILAHGMLRVDRIPHLSLISHVHDEFVADVRKDVDMEEFRQAFGDKFWWSDGLPIELAIWEGAHYDKR